MQNFNFGKTVFFGTLDIGESPETR